MKKFLVTGCIRCGHKVFTLEKYVVAVTASDAIRVFKISFPNAKMIRSETL